MVDEELLEKYKKHPRVLEVRFILLYNLIEKEYGHIQTMKFYESICNAFNCNMVFIRALINRRFDIQKNSKKNYRMWRQEVIFSSACYGESLYKVAKEYLNVKPETLYVQSESYDINQFCTNEWLNKLDNQMCLCSEQSFRIEVMRFFEVLEAMCKVLTKWEY